MTSRATARRLPALLLTLIFGAAGAGHAQATRAGDLRYPPLPPFDIPQPERVVLDNGLVVMLLEDHELPLVEAIALVRSGGRFDPAEKVGLTDLAAGVMRTGGTRTLPGDALDDFLENRAASIEVNGGEDLVQARLRSLTADFPQVLTAFADVIRHPAFDAAKLEVARTRAIADVSRSNDEAQDILFREMSKLVYGADSPYARTRTYASLGAITRDDLEAWHKGGFHPDRMVLGLVGDFRRDEALGLVRQAFGDWPKGPEWRPAPSPFKQQPSPGVYQVEKDDVTQSSILLGHLGVVMTDPDYYALEVMNQALSGSFASRLVANVRTRKGLAYAVFGAVGSEPDHPGTTLLFASTKTETTGAGIDALLEEARNLTAQPLTAAEVETAKQSLLSSFVFRFDSRREVLNRQVFLEVYGFPRDWLSRYRAGIEAVTLEQVRKAARHLRPEDLSILVVGPSQGMDKPLSTWGPVRKIDVALPEPPGKPPV